MAVVLAALQNLGGIGGGGLWFVWFGVLGFVWSVGVCLGCWISCISDPNFSFLYPAIESLSYRPICFVGLKSP